MMIMITMIVTLVMMLVLTMILTPIILRIIILITLRSEKGKPFKGRKVEPFPQKLLVKKMQEAST